MSKISAYIIAYNQADKIRDCINSLRWADEIILADSHSTDGTDTIAESMGVKVVQIDFEGFGKLRNETLKHCQFEWVFSLDSDERCTRAARDAILNIVNQQNPPHDVYFVPRKNFFLGKWIKHSGWYPNFRQPQLFRKGALEYKNDDIVHEGFHHLSQKTIGTLTADIWQVPFNSLEEIIEKMNRYSSLGAEKLAKKQAKTSYPKALLRGIWSFTKHYVFKRGFLDGWPGFIIALGNFEGTFYRYAKYQTNQQDISPPKVEPIYRDTSKGS